MKCPRCEKEFPLGFPNVQQWLENSKLDVRQLSFLLFNYGAPLCDECKADLISGFYLSGTNPVRKKNIS